MLLVWRVVQPHGDEDEEDEERPDDFHEELELQHTRCTNSEPSNQRAEHTEILNTPDQR